MRHDNPLQTWAEPDLNPRTATSKTSSYFPLTTIFTAPASCLESRLFGIEPKQTPPRGFRDFLAHDTECWPPYYREIELPPVVGTTGWYSPGVCPHSWTVAHSELLEGGSQVTTQAWCCPSGMALDEGKHGGGMCSSNVITPTAIHHNGTTTTTSNFYALMHPISVQWGSSDLSLFTPPSAPILPRVSASTTSSLSGTTNSASQSNGGNSNQVKETGNGFGTGEQAGIGVGVGIAGALLLAFAVWLLIRRKRRNPERSENPYAAQVSTNARPAPIQEIADSRAPERELEARNRSGGEIDSSPRNVFELNTKRASRAWELQGRGLHEM